MSPLQNIVELVREINAESIRAGFVLCGIVPPEPLNEEATYLEKWLMKGNHATMGYMERNLNKRANPKDLFPGTKSIISLAFNYFHPYLHKEKNPRISIYALHRDYHNILKEKVKGIIRLLHDFDSESQNRVFTDSAPVFEKALAVKAGLGWIGKNSCLINHHHGSFLFLAEIFTSIELPESQPEIKNYCGNCTLCIEACPVNAISEPFVIDSNLCISYQTIENREAIPAELHNKLSGNIFGCDICQKVCPWNNKAKPHTEPAFSPSEPIKNLTIEAWKTLTEEEFKRHFKNSPLMRAGYRKIMETVKIIDSGTYDDSPHENDSKL